MYLRSKRPKSGHKQYLEVQVNGVTHCKFPGLQSSLDEHKIPALALIEKRIFIKAIKL